MNDNTQLDKKLSENKNKDERFRNIIENMQKLEDKSKYWEDSYIRIDSEFNEFVNSLNKVIFLREIIRL